MIPHKPIKLIGFILLTVLSATLSLSANRLGRSGGLDLSFNGQGYVHAGFREGSSDSVSGTAMQTDGKTVVVGTTQENFFVLRYNTDGTLDQTFNGTGKVFAAFKAGGSYATAVAIQADGKIVVAGTTYYRIISEPAALNFRYDFALARFNSDGTLDRTFDGDGKVTTAMGTSVNGSFGMTIQPDGRIVVVGFSRQSGMHIAVVRYNSNGSLDTSFDGDGRVRTTVGVNSYAEGVAVQPDGKIVVVGGAWTSSAMDFALVRYNSDGSLDTSFNGSGIVHATYHAASDLATEVTILADGKLLVGGFWGGALAVARFEANGALDLTFAGGGGVVVSSVGQFSGYADAMAVQNDGKILLSGCQGGGGSTPTRFAVQRFNPDGSFDETFHGDSLAVTNFKGHAYPSATEVQPDGKIIVVGQTSDQSNNPIDVALVRYTAAGIPDSSFGDEGIAFTDVADARGSPGAMALQPDGKILVTGNSNVSDKFEIIRFNTNGSNDLTFGIRGRVLTDVSAGADQPEAIALQNDGKIVVAGRCRIGNQGVISVVRYINDGTIDASFGSDGKILTPVGTTSFLTSEIAILQDGRIVVGGSTIGDTTSQIVIVRYMADGSLDTSFDGDGKVTMSSSSLTGIAIQPDGKMLAAGGTEGGLSFVARYNTDGSLDTDFQGTGIRQFSLSVYGGSISGIAVQQDGKLVLSGTSGDPLPGSNIVVARLTHDGFRDFSFNGMGSVLTKVSPYGNDSISVIIQPDGKILVGGQMGLNSTNSYQSSDYFVLRYNSNGTLDPNWGANGLSVVDLIGTDFLYGMALDPFGRVILGGRSRNLIGVARLKGDTVPAFDL